MKLKKNNLKNCNRGISTESYFFIKWLGLVLLILGFMADTFYEKFRINDDTYYLFYSLGKIAFPLFAFILSEAYWKSTNRIKLLGKIILISCLSEIPYNYFAYNKFLYLEKQNPVFSLCYGLLGLIIAAADWDKSFSEFYKSKFIRKWIIKSSKIILVFILAAACLYSNIEYNWAGMMLVVLFGLARNKKHNTFLCFLSLIPFCILTGNGNILNLSCFFALIPINIESYRYRYPYRMVKVEKFSFLSVALKSKFSLFITNYFYPIIMIILGITKTIMA